MIRGDRILHEARYAHPVESVWRALTEPTELAVWLMPNDFVAEVGHRFQFDARPDFGFIDAEVLEIEAPRLLRCRWVVDGTPTTVTIRVEPDGDGTLLMLEHEALPPEPRTQFDGGWASKLQHDLAVLLQRQTDNRSERS
jgi:uncharacterized protein YndB with AHSA1/START domain